MNSSTVARCFPLKQQEDKFAFNSVPSAEATARLKIARR
jgi:hypothetical protein